MPALPSWLADPLWDQFAALLPPREVFVPTHPWGCHRRRIGDRIVFDKLIQVLRFGCSYDAIADTTCSATTLRARRDEWIALGVFAALARIAREAYDRIVGLLLDPRVSQFLLIKSRQRPRPRGQPGFLAGWPAQGMGCEIWRR